MQKYWPAPMCEAAERNAQAAYELEGMAREWRVDIPRIIRILTGQCPHEPDPKGSFLLQPNTQGD